MSLARTLDVRFKATGTRFFIYPQPKKLTGFSKPETVYINKVPGTIKPGPEDDRIYVVDPEVKYPYRDEETGRLRSRPPFRDARYPPAEPDAAGHFDHIKPGTSSFPSVTVYAIVKCALEIWEGYFGRQLPWHFLNKTNRRLEVITRVEAANAWSGDGYLEFGYTSDSNLFCKNFDVVAHEMGHLIGWAVVGKPARRSMTYRANDEACADLMAMVASLHFEAMVDHLLRHTQGNLFSKNELSLVGEMVPSYRKAYNSNRMSTAKKQVSRLKKAHPREYANRYKYILSRPFTGGAFDVLVRIYEQGLIDRGVISQDLAKRSYRARGRKIAGVRREFRRHFKRRRERFTSALLDARDYFGVLLARALDRTPMKARSHAAVGANMIAADVELSGGRYGPWIRECFERREILRPTTR